MLPSTVLGLMNSVAFAPPEVFPSILLRLMIHVAPGRTRMLSSIVRLLIVPLHGRGSAAAGAAVAAADPPARGDERRQAHGQWASRE